jgi:glycosyltransferase involved in cell wall biosynthesis
VEVLFAPDWRQGVPYQKLLAEALAGHGVKVEFLEGYKRVLPLSRLLAGKRCDVLHLHWPEAYYPRRADGLDWFRRARFTVDLGAALKCCRLVTTAHNLRPHDRAHESFVHRNARIAHQRAGVVFAHSNSASRRLASEFELLPEAIRVIPLGDLSIPLGRPLSSGASRSDLGVRGEKLVLMFGTVEPYKGQEEVIGWWKQAQPPATLVIVGNPISEDYAARIAGAISQSGNIVADLRWQSNERLRQWLSAADAVLFNYRDVFTSGAAGLARSWGLPMLLPSRVDALELDEPSPFVRRFSSIDTDFADQLERALELRPDYDAARSWRERCSWDRVAALTAAGYRAALAS